MSKQTSRGFHVSMIMVIVAVIILLGVVGTLFVQALNKKPGEESTGLAKLVGQISGANNSNEPDLKIKHIGINLDYYDPATGKAGDVVFTKTGIEQYDNLIFFDYGKVAKANSARPADTKNPQPTFIIPLGTKIHSLVDGVVVSVEKLYSNDHTIHVASSADSNWIYETEHIDNPKVKVGDTVKAGQVIAEASKHDSQYHPGFGLYEIGILKGGNPPEHVCLFNYLDDSIKKDVQAKLKAFYKSWEEYMGDTTLYDESKHVVPGCLTLDPIAG